MGKLTGKAVVVTGASSGMGKAIVELFVREGALVVAVARRKERLEQLADSLKNAEGKILIFPGDVSKRETNEDMIQKAIDAFGRLDILVNNAGIMDDMSPVGEASDEMFEKVMKVNLYGPMCAMRKAVSVFLEQGDGGNIINVASLGGMRTCAGAVYCASKAAMLSMTRNTAYMYMPDKIRCNAIAPGGINSEISASMGNINMNGYKRLQNVIACGPAPGETSDIAAAALFLAGDDSGFVNGEALVVDGGWNAG